MKSLIKTLSIIAILILSISGCEKDEFDYADGSIEIPTYPGISIYKANGNYNDYLAVCLDSVGNISCVPLFGNYEDVVTEKKDGYFTLNNRYFLKSGYILEDIYLDYAFTDITITEMVNTFTEYGAEYWSNERYLNRVIDQTPFLEFYHFDGTNKHGKITISEINDMIENGTLEEYFEKLK